MQDDAVQFAARRYFFSPTGIIMSVFDLLCSLFPAQHGFTVNLLSLGPFLLCLPQSTLQVTKDNPHLEEMVL